MDEENIGVAILDNTGGEETCTKSIPRIAKIKIKAD
jgi:hypothetical protein